MTQQGGERMLSEEEVGLALAAHGLPAARLPVTALMIAREAPLRIVWANGEATQLFGTRDARALSGQLFTGVGRDGLIAAVGRLKPGAGPRGERLRLYRGFRTRTLSVAVSRAQLPGGDEVVVITVPTGGLSRHGQAAALQDLAAGSIPSEAVPADRPAMPAVPVVPAADVLARLARRGRRRFLWQTGPDGHLTRLSGADDLRPVPAGTSLAAFLEGTAVEAEGDILSTFSAAVPFHTLSVAWPLAEAPGHVPVRLGGLPVRQAGGFAGFRGFGIADFDRAVVVPVAAAEQPALNPGGADHLADAPFDAARPESGAATDPAPFAADLAGDAPGAEWPEEEPAAGAPAHSAPGDATPEAGADNPPDQGSTDLPASLAAIPDVPASDWPDAADTQGQMPEGEATPELRPRHDEDVGTQTTPPELRTDRKSPADAAPSPRGGKVVALRRFLQIGSNGGFGGPANSDAAPAQRRPDANLSFTEQFNFNEIARALKGPPPSRSDDQDPPGAGAGDHAALLAALPVAVLVVCGGRLAYANPAFSTLTGFAGVPALEAAGGLAHLLGGLDPAQVAAGTQDRAFPVVGADGQVLSVEGRLVALHWTGQPATGLTMRLAGDRSAEIQNLQFDVRRREREATEARALLEQASVATVVLDAQGRVLGLSGAGETLFGVHQNGVVGEPVGTLLTAESQSAVLGAVAAAGGAQGSGGNDTPSVLAAGLLPVTGRRASGDAMPLAMSVRALGPGRVGAVFRDRGETDVLRQEVARLTADLAGSAAERFDFLAKVSHEIRTPLNAILGFAEVMLDERFGPVGNPRYKDYLTDIRAAGTHVMDLVEDLLDLSKMKAGRGEMKVAATDVNRVIGDVVADMQGLAHRDRVIVRMSLPPHLPPALVDEAAIRQVMGIILSNAIRYNEPGGQVIVSTAATEGQSITVRVRDTGVGMSEAEVARALEPFREIATDQPGHAGLGLPMARALVEANQATLSVRSRKQEGTLVEIVLRAASETASAPAA